MMNKQTEARHPASTGIDIRADDDVLAILLDAQKLAAANVGPAIPAIAKAAHLAAAALLSGGRLVYAGAGSSGLMAMADALELPGTYGIALDQIVILLAGGVASLSDLAGGTEDDRDLAQSDCERTGLTGKDCIIAVSASGSTPYVLQIVEEARRVGASVIGMANNPATPLLTMADCAILLATPPEVISGSTRMGAGTAQKIAFNMFSTLLGIRLGHVHDGLMVNVRADNGKLRDRAARIVSEIAGIDKEQAKDLLGKADGSAKIAVLLARGAKDKTQAEALLAEAGNTLRIALGNASLSKEKT